MIVALLAADPANTAIAAGSVIGSAGALVGVLLLHRRETKSHSDDNRVQIVETAQTALVSTIGELRTEIVRMKEELEASRREQQMMDAKIEQVARHHEECEAQRRALVHEVGILRRALSG